VSGIDRRTALRWSAFALASAAVARPLHARAAGLPVRLSLPSAGTAGGVWKPFIDESRAAAPLAITWIGGDPGNVETQLLARAVDVSAFGAFGASEAALHGASPVIFAPGLYNHGRWIVRSDSSYRTPRDLRGKRIATLPETSDTYRQARMAAALAKLDLANDFDVVHGPATANLALFDRGDVEAVLTIEPTATRLVAAGAREIAKVGDMWRAATGDAHPLFLVGQTADAGWLAANRATARAVATLFGDVNAAIRAHPERLADLHAAYGIPDTETAAIRLLPSRLRDIYAADWGSSSFASLERQIDVAVKLGILPQRPAQRVYAALTCCDSCARRCRRSRRSPSSSRCGRSWRSRCTVRSCPRCPRSRRNSCGSPRAVRSFRRSQRRSCASPSASRSRSRSRSHSACRWDAASSRGASSNRRSSSD
jgi:NitT/TauT family transport system substrate-binding protein